MFKFVLLIGVSLLGSGLCHHHHNEAMESEGVVPDVIEKVPAEILDVKYNDKIVDLGKELTPTMVKNEPTVSWKAEKDVFYTLAMVDPDAPSRKEPKFREVNHWLVTNILNKDIKNANVITAYLGSGPPKGTDLHRYVFLLYKQPKKLDFSEPKTGPLSRDHRLNFSIKKFAQKYNLGQPIAGNFFKAQWNSYVDERNKNLH